MALLAVAVPAWSQVQVTTQHNDNLRSGANMNETILNTTNVNVNTFGKLFSCAVDGLIFAQPLYMPGLTINGAKRNVVYVATAHDSVFAFDADTGARLWQTSLGTPVPSSVISTPNIQVEVGIISTPVIDPSTGTLYVVAKTYTNNVQQFWLHALNILNGLDSVPAVQIAAQSTGTGYSTDTKDGNGHVLFVASQENQRPAVTLVKGTGDPLLYLAFASHEDHDPYHGWVLAYDASTLAQVAAYNDTPNTGRGGIWMSGQGLVVDAANNIYMITGNSTTATDTASDDFGESFLKLTLTGSTLAEKDFFKPSNFNALDSSDQDLGAGGAIAIPGTTLLAGEGKKGVLYLVNSTNMGHLNTSSDQVVQEFGTGGGLWSSPVYWNGSAPTMFVWGNKDVLKGFAFNTTTNLFATMPSAGSVTLTGSSDACGDLAVSSNGSAASSGIVWASVPNGSPSSATVAGTLYAYSATPNGSTLTQLWNSRQNTTARDDFGKWAKYVPPTVANGKVYMATHSQQLVVYGLLANPSLGQPTGVSATAGAAKVTLTWTPPAGTVQYYNIYRSGKSGGQTAGAWSHVAASPFTDSQVAAGVTYYYRVAAVNGTGAGAQSSEVSATPTAAAASATLAGLSPSGAAIGSPDVTVTITGASLPSNAVAHWTSSVTGVSNALATTFVSATKLTATVPAADLTAAGSGTITVTPGPAGTPTGPLVFTIGVPTVQVTGVNFSGGSGTNVQVTITVTDKSTFQVAGVQLTGVTLVTTNSRLAATGVPVALTPSTLSAQGSGTATITFPASSSLTLSSVRGIQFVGSYVRWELFRIRCRHAVTDQDDRKKNIDA